MASFSPFLQSQTTIQWLSSRPTDASFLPSPEIISKVYCIKIKFPGYQWHSIHVLTTETKKFFFHSTKKYISITWCIWLLQDFSTKHLLSDVSINQFTTKLMVYLYTTTCMYKEYTVPEKSTAHTPLWCCPFKIEAVFKVSASHTWTAGSRPTCRVQ